MTSAGSPMTVSMNSAPRLAISRIVETDGRMGVSSNPGMIGMWMRRLRASSASPGVVRAPPAAWR